MYEIDRAEVLTYKAEKLGASGAKPMCQEYHLLHADVVADPWDKMLLERGDFVLALIDGRVISQLFNPRHSTPSPPHRL